MNKTPFDRIIFHFYVINYIIRTAAVILILRKLTAANTVFR